MSSTPLLRAACLLALALASGCAHPPSVTAAKPASGRKVVQLRYESDPTVPPMPPDAAFCAGAPFPASLSVRGPLTPYLLSEDGSIERGRPVGTARACLQLADPSFAPFGKPVLIYWELVIEPLGTFKAEGQCLPTSNAMPQPGIILGGCVLKLTSAPEWVQGGNVVESANLFNPGGQPGFELSSSIFTLNLFVRP